VKSKGYTFNFSALGHGSYMISSNGGTWSNTDSTANNTVKAFKFAKGDIIICEFSPAEKLLTFYKEKDKAAKY